MIDPTISRLLSAAQNPAPILSEKATERRKGLAKFITQLREGLDALEADMTDASEEAYSDKEWRDLCSCLVTFALIAVMHKNKLEKL